MDIKAEEIYDIYRKVHEDPLFSAVHHIYEGLRESAYRGSTWATFNLSKYKNGIDYAKEIQQVFEDAGFDTSYIDFSCSLNIHWHQLKDKFGPVKPYKRKEIGKSGKWVCQLYDGDKLIHVETDSHQCGAEVLMRQYLLTHKVKDERTLTFFLEDR